MDFHQIEAALIHQDEKDNQLLADLLKQHHLLQNKYAEAQQQIVQLSEELSQLKQLSKADAKVPPYLYSNSEPLFFKEYGAYLPSQHNCINIQHTKRKVINGFVAELTNELENSEQLLLKERKMHEELRKSLQQCNEEVLAVRGKNRALEIELSGVMSENRQLIGQLSDMQVKKEALETDFKQMVVEVNQLRTSYMRREKDNEGEFDLMDQIYRQIEVELESA